MKMTPPFAGDAELPRACGRQVALLPICCLLGLLACWLQVAACEPSQQQQQRTGGANSPNELTGQDLFAAAGADAGLASLGAYGRGAYANTKRARKMSAFMPMRGRKDGRDQQTFQEGRLDGAPRELDSSSGVNQELSLLRLMNLRNSQGAGNRYAPRQFVEQLELMGEQLARQRSAPLTGEPIMEAKFRRAFHPMRGKRFGGSEFQNQGDNFESGGQEALNQGDEAAAQFEFS